MIYTAIEFCSADQILTPNLNVIKLKFHTILFNKISGHVSNVQENFHITNSTMINTQSLEPHLTRDQLTKNWPRVNLID